MQDSNLFVPAEPPSTVQVKCQSRQTEAHQRTATTHVTTTAAKSWSTTPPNISVWSADSKRAKHEEAPSDKKTIVQSTTTEKGVHHTGDFLIAANFKQQGGSERINNELKQRFTKESGSNNELGQETSEESHPEESQVTDSELRKDTGEESMSDERTPTHDQLDEDSSKIFKFNKIKGEESLMRDNSPMHGELKKNHSKEHHLLIINHSVSSSPNELVSTSPPPLLPLPSPTSIPLQMNATDAKNGVRSGDPTFDTTDHLYIGMNTTAPNDKVKQNQTHQILGTNRNITRAGSTDFVQTTGSVGQTPDIKTQLSVNDGDKMDNLNENSVTRESKDVQQHGDTVTIYPANNTAGIVTTSADINTAALRGLLAFSEPSMNSATRTTIVERSMDGQDKLSAVRHKVERHVNDEPGRGEERHTTDAHDTQVMYNNMDSPPGTAPNEAFISYKTNPMMRTENQIYIAELRKDSNQIASEKKKFYKNADDTKLTKMMLSSDNDSTSAVEFATVIEDKNETGKSKLAKKNRKFLKQAADTDDALFVISKDVNEEKKDTKRERMLVKVGLDNNRPEANKHEVLRTSTVSIIKKHISLTKIHSNMRSGSQHQRMKGSESKPPSKQIHVVKNHVDMTQGDAKYGRTTGTKRKTAVHSSKQISVQKNHPAMEAVDKYRRSGRSEGKSDPDYSKLVTRKPTNIRPKVELHPRRRMRVDKPAHQVIRRLSVNREFVRSYSEQQQNGRTRKTPNIARNNHEQMIRVDSMDKEVSDKPDGYHGKTDHSDIESFERHLRKVNKYLPTIINSDKRTDAISANKNTFPEADRMIRTNDNKESYDRNMDNQVNIDAQLNYNAAKNKIPLEATIGVDRPHSAVYSGVINVGTDYEILNNKGKHVVSKHGNSYKTGFENGQKLDANVRKYGMPKRSDVRNGVEQASQKQRERRKYYIQIYPDNFGSYDRQNPYEKRYRNDQRRPIDVSSKRNDAEHNTDPGERSQNRNVENKPIRARSGRREGLRQLRQNPEEEQQRHRTAGQRSVSAAITRPADDGHERRGHTDMWWWRLVEHAMKESQDDTSLSPLPTQRNTERFNKSVKSHGRQRLPAIPEQELVEQRRHRAPNLKVYDSYDYTSHRDTEDNIDDDARGKFDGEGGGEFGLVAGEGGREFGLVAGEGGREFGLVDGEGGREFGLVDGEGGREFGLVDGEGGGEFGLVDGEGGGEFGLVDGEGGGEFGLVAGEGLLQELRRDRQDNWPDVTTETGGRMESTTTEVIVNRADGLAEQGEPCEIYCSWLQESNLILNLLVLERIFLTCATFRSASPDVDHTLVVAGSLTYQCVITIGGCWQLDLPMRDHHWWLLAA